MLDHFRVCGILGPTIEAFDIEVLGESLAVIALSFSLRLCMLEDPAKCAGRALHGKRSVELWTFDGRASVHSDVGAT